MTAIKGHGGSRGFRDDTLNVSSSSRPEFLSVFDSETYYPIFSTFCGYLSISEIVSLTRTCKKMSGLYRYLLPLQWDVNEALRPYFDDPQCFRSQTAKCDALLIGQFATQYFERTVKGSRRLDVIVQRDRSQIINSYLSDEAGYECINTLAATQRFWFETQTFHKKAASKTSIHLHITSCPPVEAILREMRTTVSGCILSWNKAYSVFALPTSIQHKSYLLRECDGLTERKARSNSQEGWLVQGVMWPEDKRRNDPIRTRRRVGDHYTWKIPLNTEGVESSKTPDNVLEYSCFEMDLSMSYSDYEEYDTEKEDVRHYKISFSRLESKVLKHTYLYGQSVMKDFFVRRLHSFVILELRKLDPAQRPAQYDEILRNRGNIDALLEGFNRPASWTYRDDQIPTWYKAFERLYPERN